MNKKSILLIIVPSTLLLFVFLGYFGCTPAIEGGYVTSHEQAVQSLYVKAKQFNETDYVMRPKEFLTVKEFLESGEIHTIEVYYIPWSWLTNYRYSEEALRNHVAERVMKNPSDKHLSEIKEALEEFPLEKMQSDPPDYRLGFVAKDCSDRVLTISVVYNQPVMSINGIQYKTKPKLVASVIELLPHKSYRRINKELVYFWHFGNMRPYP